MSTSDFIRYMQNNPDKLDLPLSADQVTWRMIEDAHRRSQFIVHAGGTRAGRTYFNRLLTNINKSNMQQKFVPYNKERAKAGEPVKMKNGTRIKRILAFDYDFPGYPLLVSYLDDRGYERTQMYTVKGESNLHGSCGDGGTDLVMAPTELVVWIGVYHGSEAKGLTAGAYFYRTKEEADDRMKGDHGYIGAFNVEVTIQPKHDGA